MGSYKRIQLLSLFAGLLGVVTLGIGIWMQVNPSKYDTITACEEAPPDDKKPIPVGATAPLGITVGVLCTLLGIGVIIIDLEKFLGMFGVAFFIVFVASLAGTIVGVKDLINLPKNASDAVNCSDFNFSTTVSSFGPTTLFNQTTLPTSATTATSTSTNKTEPTSTPPTKKPEATTTPPTKEPTTTPSTKKTDATNTPPTKKTDATTTPPTKEPTTTPSTKSTNGTTNATTPKPKSTNGTTNATTPKPKTTDGTTPATTPKKKTTDGTTPTTIPMKKTTDGTTPTTIPMKKTTDDTTPATIPKKEPTDGTTPATTPKKRVIRAEYKKRVLLSVGASNEKGENLTTYEDASKDTKYRLIGYSCLLGVDSFTLLLVVVFCLFASR